MPKAWGRESTYGGAPSLRPRPSHPTCGDEATHPHHCLPRRFDRSSLAIGAARRSESGCAGRSELRELRLMGLQPCVGSSFNRDATVFIFKYLYLRINAGWSASRGHQRGGEDDT
jgi:hypothetical protein